MRSTLDVILPVFNGEQTLPRALTSVLSQRGEVDIHVYCIDDGSTDDSLELLQRFAEEHDNVTVTANDENVGVSTSRNLGVSLGSGDFVCFIDQDDEWTPHKLELQLAGFGAPEEIRYSTGLQQMVLEENTTRPNWCRPEWLEGPVTGFLPSTLLMTRATWDLVGEFDPALRSGGDDVEWFARARRSDIDHHGVPEVVLRRYISGRNLSSDAVNTTQDLLAVARRQVSQSRSTP